jgi:carbamoyltransferase
MIILGINGWYTRSHDPSACLIKDGKILAMAEEERFIRQKYAVEKLPLNAIGFCFNETGLKPDDIDVVAFGWDYREKYKSRGINFGYSDDEILDIIFPCSIFKYKRKPKFVIIPHHLAHAASTFFTSGFNEATILVVDGQGENESTTIAYGKGNKIQILKSFPIKDSLGYFYESINKYIGFHYLDSGKTMGLAPYGRTNINFHNIQIDDRGYRVTLKKELRYDSSHLDEQEALVTLWHEELKKHVKSPNKVEYIFDKNSSRIKAQFNISQSYKDLAASAQSALEKTIIHLVKVAIQMTGVKDVCLSGGVALNCVANGKLLQNTPINNLFIFPSANDAGVSAGAALYAAALYDKDAKFAKMTHPYFGPKYTSKEIEKILKSRKIRYTKPKDVCGVAAKLLAENKVIGWFQGRMEIGPRALGNRSILANPLIKSNWKRVNIIKGRELWRPLAPSILDEYQGEYFENAVYSPFMLTALQVRKEKRAVIPAIVHVDGSSRPQTVSKNVNRKFWSLISHFHKLTGVPVVLNTSFNGPGEPIVCSPQDALLMFNNSGLDHLIINDYLISK